MRTSTLLGLALLAPLAVACNLKTLGGSDEPKHDKKADAGAATDGEAHASYFATRGELCDSYLSLDDVGADGKAKLTMTIGVCGDAVAGEDGTAWKAIAAGCSAPTTTIPAATPRATARAATRWTWSTAAGWTGARATR